VKYDLVHFEFGSLRWDWNEDGIDALEISEDIIDFLVQNTLQDGLHKETLEILKLASCLGNRGFHSNILSIVMGTTAEDVNTLQTL